jgi:hypothetical protein
MAKKARKKSAAKRGKKSKPAKKKKAARRVTRRKAKRKTIGDRLSNAYHTVVDTVKGTDQLRNKMEKPGTSETE